MVGRISRRWGAQLLILQELWLNEDINLAKNIIVPCSPVILSCIVDRSGPVSGYSKLG